MTGEHTSSNTIGYGATSSSSSNTSPQIANADDDSRARIVDGKLHRGLSARQVQMIAIAGTIGTGLFLGTGKSLAEGGPASILICYAIIGFIVYVTLLLLGEMATQYPVAGSFNAYTVRFFSPSYGFALSWNYWFNDAVSVASDLTAAQLVLQFWTVQHAWIVSLVFWLFLVSINAVHVRAYGELEYWLSSLKVVTIIIFIILGILVNVGVNQKHEYIGARYWYIPNAPFVGGFGGFAQVFVTASFAYGGTESLGITAGETKNPSKNMPRVVKFVFWRILLFYLLSILLIGLDVPWNYPDLSNQTTTTSPFTLVFQQAGSTVAASFMNTVILTSVLSAGNHALFAGTRVLYGLSVTSPRQAPAIFSKTSSKGVPIPALLLTSSISALCFGSSFIGSGTLWGWLQNIVGVSNQIAWFSIGIASWRFRKAWLAQGRSLEELKFRPKWTWPWGPPFVVITVAAIIIIQGWSAVIPTFSPVSFVSYYIEIPVMVIMYLAWTLKQHMGRSSRSLAPTQAESEGIRGSPRSPSQTPLFDRTRNLARPSSKARGRRRVNGGLWWWWYNDIVDVHTVDLYRDEYEEEETERVDEGEGGRRAKDSNIVKRTLWKVLEFVA
ncbi:amino acid permease-domain-containing protein [Lentinula raphanica]|uniref:Amino acid permease-domain-containing protein n=1 Tax=Lentinula raphanica TaxID=153919 RepID=A0AA38PJ11_9AGAR|nr:amino acid permease-domain-containing protein [Lentinula raphanica]KAJ3965639.1 amino acid permease-domain-containing protein [Lentinula raphanica]